MYAGAQQREQGDEHRRTSYPDTAFQYGVVSAGVVTLLVVLLSINSIAILIRNKYQTENST